VWHLIFLRGGAADEPILRRPHLRVARARSTEHNQMQFASKGFQRIDNRLPKTKAPKKGTRALAATKPILDGGRGPVDDESNILVSF